MQTPPGKPRIETDATRERFAPGELAVVLSHYDLGVVEQARELHRGSRRSPKLLLRTGAGDYLLKRRARGRDDPRRVAFAHGLMRHLRARRFPVPALVPARDGSEALTVGERVYELFEFVHGERYAGSLEETTSAGKMLARFHHAAADFDPPWKPAGRGYHDSEAVLTGLNLIPSTISGHDSVVGQEAELLSATQELYERYEDAVARLAQLGFASWPAWIVHGDWHPGNMLFSRGRVAVVLDFDSARVQPRAADVANAMLQFSILRGGGDPDQWPDFFDVTRMRRFLLGYLAKVPLEPDQRRGLCPLMIESIIAECVVPVAATGSLGQIPGFGVVMMVRRKVRWLLASADRLEQWILE